MENLSRLTGHRTTSLSLRWTLLAFGILLLLFTMTTQPVLGDEPLGVEFYVTSFLWVVAAGTLWLGVGWAALTGLLAAAGVRILFGYVSIQQELFVLVMVGVLASYARPAHRRLYAVVALPWLLSQFVGMEDIQLQVLGAVVVLILTALAYAIGHIVGRLREDRDRSNSALRQAEGSLVEQRSALARELHDNAVSDLTVIVMKAQQLKLTQEGENWASELESILDRANITIDHMGRIVTLLRDNEPISEHQDRVVPAISEELVKAKNELDASGIVTTVESTNGADSLGPRVQLALHRILREAVANVLKYGAFSSDGRPACHIRFAVEDDCAELLVQNEVDPARQRTSPSVGVGLDVLQERAAAYGADVSVGPDGHAGWSLHLTNMRTG